jgi:hypothetical protein
MKAMQFMQSFAPGYQSSQTQINKTYGMPIDPLQQGIAAGLGGYASLYGNQYGNYGQNTGTGTGTGTGT